MCMERILTCSRLCARRAWVDMPDYWRTLVEPVCTSRTCQQLMPYPSQNTSILTSLLLCSFLGQPKIPHPLSGAGRGQRHRADGDATGDGREGAERFFCLHHSPHCTGRSGRQCLSVARVVHVPEGLRGKTAADLPVSGATTGKVGTRGKRRLCEPVGCCVCVCGWPRDWW